MNSRGAMEIILGLLALEAGIIRQRLFVALVVMAIITSMTSGPVMRFLLRQTKKRRLRDVLSSKLFLPELKAASRREAIQLLSARASEACGLPATAVESVVWAREETLSTGIGHGVALPHGRIEGLREPLVVVGISEKGIDFDAPDDRLAKVIFLILTPADDFGAQLEISAELARLFRDPHILDNAIRAKSYTRFLAVMRSSVQPA